MPLKDLLQINTLSIVFIGQFNPVIFQPFWLANKKLIREHEAEKTKVELIHNDLVRFDLDWVFIEVTRERFELRTSKEPYFAPVRDLAIGIFSILNETPITSLGINHIFHCALKNEKIYYEFGNTLSPLANWKTILKEPRLLNLDILEQEREDDLPGHYRVRIEPSTEKLTTNYTFSININNHFNIESQQGGGNHNTIKTFSENWDKSFLRAISISDHILNLNSL